MKYMIPIESFCRLQQIAQVAYSTFETIQHTYQATRHALTLDGCLVECGVAAGAQIGAMCQALQDASQRRTVHLYDSFEGIPFAGTNDVDQPGIGPMTHDPSAPLRERLKTTGISAATVDNVRNNLQRWGFDYLLSNMAFHKGWFQDTLPDQAPKEPIALLRLDGDLYESTEWCLNALYDLVAPGAMVIADDYGLPGCRKAIHDFFERRSLPVPTVEYVPENTVAYWIKT